MKNQLLFLCMFSLFVFAACTGSTSSASTADGQDTSTEEPNYEDWNKNIEIVRAFLQAHCDEDLAKQTEMLSDTLSWSPPYYNGNQTLNKADYVEALKGYHDNFENIKYEEGVQTKNGLIDGMWGGSHYPEAEASNEANQIRAYGTWTAKHTESGKDIGVKWFAIISINADGKISAASEYWDVNGLAVQIAAE